MNMVKDIQDRIEQINQNDDLFEEIDTELKTEVTK